MKIEPLVPQNSKNKYSGGTIFGIILVVIIASLIMGSLIGLAYMKFNKKTNFLPVMKFTNPNYEKN